MIEIDASLLSESSLSNLIDEVISRTPPTLPCTESQKIQKQLLLQKIQQGLAVITYDIQTHRCDILSTEDWQNIA